MSKNINQIFTGNPAVSFQNTDLMYLGRSPYGAANDMGFQYSTLSAQFAPAVGSTSIVTLGTVTTGTWTATIISPTYGGTGVNNAAKTITLGGTLTTSGAFNSTFTMTAATNVTFPPTGTLATTSQIPSFPLSLANGGTNASLTASNGGLFYSTASAGAILSGTATANQIPLSGSSSAPSWSTATYPATTTINQLLYSSSANTIAGLATANSAMLSTTSAGVPAWSASMTNGQLMIGSTGATPAPGTLTAGTGITITNGAASITVAINGANPWVDETGASVTMAPNTGYTSDDGATLVTFTLPTTSAIGDWVEINGKGSGLWTIAQASGQQIHMGNQATTSGAGGSLSSSLQYDNVRLRCLTANTIWTVVSSQGNLTPV